jgi:hypothetical protein
VLRLQRQIGNQAVLGMLQREGEDEEMQASRDLTVQRQGEEEELQASRDLTLQREGEDDELQAARDPALQRDDDLLAVPEVGMEGGAVSAATAERIQALRGGGAPLDAQTRSSMEGAFETQFDGVRLHTGSEASAVSRSIGARAFTAGNDVFLRDDAYQPGTADGQRLLSHELTHVVQQRSMPPSGPGMRVGPAGDHYEQAADAKAADVAAKVGPGAAQAKRDE